MRLPSMPTRGRAGDLAPAFRRTPCRARSSQVVRGGRSWHIPRWDRPLRMMLQPSDLAMDQSGNGAKKEMGAPVERRDSSFKLIDAPGQRSRTRYFDAFVAAPDSRILLKLDGAQEPIAEPACRSGCIASSAV